MDERRGERAADAGPAGAAVSGARPEVRVSQAGLRDHPELLLELLDNTPAVIYVKDAAGRYRFVNRRYEQILGRHAEEVIGRTDPELFPAAVADEIEAHDKQVLERAEAQEFEEVVPQADGPHTFISSKFPIRDCGGRPCAIGSISADITERKRAEEALRKSEERFELAVRGTNDGLWDWDIETGRVYFSPRWKAMLGYQDHEIANVFASWEQRLHPDDRERALNMVQDYLSGRVDTYELEHRLQQKDGSYRWILARGVALRDVSGRPYRMAGSHTDIARRKAAEERVQSTQNRLIQAEKLSALGQVVAGVAHEINNPLAYVINNLAVLERDDKALHELLRLYRQGEQVLAEHRPDLHGRIRALADRIDVGETLRISEELVASTRDGLNRIEQVVRDLRTFARVDSHELHPADLNDGVRSTVHIVRERARRKGVELAFDPGELPPVRCFPAKINQVVLNLLANALEATPAGGQVRVETRVGDDGGVVIHVRDTGPGIGPAIRGRIFDPFFTTKPPGEGNGLGLAISYGIVQDHGGRIELAAGDGPGAHFIVHLPLAPPRRTERDG